MGLNELLRWQWEGYARYHGSRANLLLHIVVVPLFLCGNVALVLGLVAGGWGEAVAGLVAMVVSVIAQGRGHALEVNPPVPFSGPGNAVARIFLEQWVSFPRFVLTGGWWRAFQRAG
ncbi:Mpo1-like protein [Burkholderiaceae bacterium UC74_6]